MHAWAGWKDRVIDGEAHPTALLHATHTTKKIFCKAFWNCFRRRTVLKTASVNASINQGGRFLLTEAVL